MDFGCFSSQIKSYRKSKPKDCRVGEYTRSVLPKAKPKWCKSLPYEANKHETDIGKKEILRLDAIARQFQGNCKKPVLFNVSLVHGNWKGKQKICNEEKQR